MGKVIIDAVSGYSRVYVPKKCEECLVYDDTGWCLYYRHKATEKAKPEFCRVVQIVVEEE